MKIKETVTSTLTAARLYWNTPPLGKYMTYKEIVAYSGGGIGVYFITTIVTSLIVSTTNSILASGIGIDYDDLYIIYIVATIVGIPFTMLRARMVDNTRNKKGKYRSFLMKMGIPTVLLSIGYVWMPYERWMPIGATEINPHGSGYYLCCAAILFFNIGYQFFYNFYYDSYNCLIYVMSPNTQERTDAVAFKSVVYSLAPTIINAVMPFLAKLISNGSMVDIKLYRYVYPPISIFGLMLSLIVYTNVREKIVQARTHVVRIKLIDAFRVVAKNKYFWIISLAGWLGFLEGAYGQIFLWLYEYGHACTEAQYALIQMVYGNASLWGMIAAPFAIKKFGKKKVIVATNVLNILFIIIMLPDVSSIYWVLFCLYMNGLVGSFTHILDPSIQADIRDYQHYISGERIDGMFATVGLIGTFITMVTSRALPLIYKSMGLSAMAHPELGDKYMTILDIDKGFVTAGLFGEDLLLYNILRVLVLASALGAVMNVIPYFFYDLSEQKHRGIIKVLKVRALFEDYGNGVLSDRDLVDAIDLVENAKKHLGKEPVPLSREEIKRAKKAQDSEGLSKAKLEYRSAVEYNEWIQDAPLVLDEINRFDLELTRKELELVTNAYNAGFEGLSNYDPAELASSKRLPNKTKQEKEYRKFAIAHAKDKRASAGLIARYYPQGLVEFDLKVFEELFNESDRIDADITAAHRELDEAKEEKNSETISECKAKLKALKLRRSEIDKKIKAATNENSRYNRAAKPYLDGHKLIRQEENYRRFDEIAADYANAKQRATENEQRLRLENEKREAEEKAYAEKLKAEKKAAKKK